MKIKELKKLNEAVYKAFNLIPIEETKYFKILSKFYGGIEKIPKRRKKNAKNSEKSKTIQKNSNKNKKNKRKSHD